MVAGPAAVAGLAAQFHRSSLRGCPTPTGPKPHTRPDRVLDSDRCGQREPFSFARIGRCSRATCALHVLADPRRALSVR